MPSQRLPKGPEYRTLGLALRALRRSASLSQIQAAAIIDVRSEFISQVERAERGMTFETLVALLLAYNADLRDLQDEIDLAGGLKGVE
jgi:transcriptional regulator with XRE-family HTH domain